MKNFKFLVVLFVFTTVVSSCKKDKENEPTKSKAELVASANGKKWKLTAWTTTTKIGQNEPEIDDNVAEGDACDRDDLMVCFSNKKIEYRLGAIKCEEDEEDEEGSWSLENEDTILSISNGNETIPFTIKQLTTTKLQLEYTASGQGISVKEAMTFDAQ